jgi:acetyl esterase/lipase
MAVSTWEVPEERPADRPAPPDLVARRQAMAGLAGTAPDVAGVAVEEITVGGVTVVRCRPDGARGRVVYFHGGGYRLGSARHSAGFGARLAGAAGATVDVVEYRLAPEHPFPAALRDGAAVYDALIDADPAPPVVAGDSAGGGLAAALVVAARRSGRPRPAGLLLLSPWVDLTVSAGTYRTRADRDQLFSATSASDAAELYLQGHDARDPLASPVFAEVADWPPTQLFAGGEEVLLDDALALTGALARAGVSVEAHVVAGMQHVWPTLFPDLAESSAALGEMARFVARRVGDT